MNLTHLSSVTSVFGINVPRVNANTVELILGRKFAAMTLDVYTDLFDDDLDAAS